ncbi:MAG: hypothetical protein ABEH59_02955, partial [Halobacteriales archaeon]
EVSSGEWRLQVDRYQTFLAQATGIAPADGLSSSDCYRIGNRLQALVEEKKRNGEWSPELVEAYPDVETLQEILWLARFFRACHDCHGAGETCYTGREREESPVPPR